MMISRNTWTLLLLHGCLISFLSFLSFDGAESREIPDLNENEDSASSVFSSTQTTVAIGLSAVASLIVVVVVVFKCTDCYNAEVSSEFHPASNGAVGFSSGNHASGGGGITFGEVVDPNASQALPYSMIPMNVPEHGGFAGYQTGGGEGGAPSTPLAGYQGYSNASAPTTEGGGARHYNPAEEQEQPPPPTYHESVRRAR